MSSPRKKFVLLAIAAGMAVILLGCAFRKLSFSVDEGVLTPKQVPVLSPVPSGTGITE